MGDRTPFETFIQVPGLGYAVPTSEMVALFDESRAFRRLLLGFAHTLLSQVSEQ
jgi:hypothetical protein